MKKAIVVLDVLIFECLNNDNLFKYLDESYFLLLWTSYYHTVDLSAIPFDGYIKGLRNGCKPYRYLRMHLRQWHPDVLGLPVVIVDFEKNFHHSRFGYDMCVDINSVVSQQEYNNRDISVIDTKKLFTDIDVFVQQYMASMRNTITEETILANNVVLTSVDLFEQVDRKNSTTGAVVRPKGKQRIVNKQCVLVVGSEFFSIYHNVDCKSFEEFLSACHLVVWMNNKNVNKLQIQNFMATMKANNINVNYMLFGLDRNVKTITLVRRHLQPTRLPFVLVDNVVNIYDCDETPQYNAMCDFDYYINLRDFISRQFTFYDMRSIIEKIRKFIRVSAPKPVDKLKIIELRERNESSGGRGVYFEDDDDDDDNEPQQNDGSGRIAAKDDDDHHIPCKRARKNNKF